MTKEVFNLGSAPNAGNGDPIRVAFQKISNNFDYLYVNANTVANTLAVVDGRIVLVNSNVATLRADLTTLSNATTANIATLNSNVSALALTVATNHQAARDYTNAATTQVQDNLNILAGAVSLQANSTTAGLNDLLTRITATNAVVSILSSNSSALTDRVSAAENAIQGLSNVVARIDALSEHDTQTDSAITNLLNRAGLADNAIMGLRGSLSDLSGVLNQNIADLQNQANATLTNLSALGTTVSQHSGSITGLGGRIDQTNIDVATLGGRADTAANSIASLGDAIQVNQQNITTVSGQIGTVQQSVGDVRAFANTIEDRVEFVENAITALSTNVASTFALSQANVASLAANTAAGFVISNAKMDAINATITSLSANSLAAASSINARLNAAAAHANATNNPHGVTPAQIGAVPTTSVGAQGGIAELDGLGKLKYSQRPAYGYGDFITGLAQIDFLPARPSLKLGSSSLPWANVFTQSLTSGWLVANAITVGGLSASVDEVVVSSPLHLTNVGDEILTSNGHAVLRHPDPSSVEVNAPNNVVVSSGAELEGHLDPQRADAIIAAQDEVVLYSNLGAGWDNRKEIRFSNTGAISTSTFTLTPTAGGLEFASGDFTISSDEVILNTGRPLIVSGVEFSYGGNAVLHLGNFQPSSKVSVSDYSNAAVLAKLITVAGPGSFLDADLLDGQHGIFYRDFTNLTNRPTTLAGYGITDALLANSVINATTLNGQNAAFYRDFTNLTNRPTTLTGYGITDGQPLSAKLTSLSGLGSDGALLLTGNTVTTVSVGASSDESLIDRQSGDVRYVQTSSANQPDGYIKLTPQGKIPSSILSDNAVVSVAALTGIISARQLKTALALSLEDITGLSAILDDKVSRSESSWSPVVAVGTGTSQNITLPQSGLEPKHVMVTITGIVQDPSEYTIVGNTLAITAPSGAGVMVRRFGVGPAFTRTASIQFVIDGSGAPIIGGIKGDITIPFDCTIVGWVLLADTTGSAEIELWRSSFDNSPPIAAGKITGSNPPVLIGQAKSKSTVLTSWNPAVNADDVLRVNVVSATTVTRITLSLTVTL